MLNKRENVKGKLKARKATPQEKYPSASILSDVSLGEDAKE